jgi:hypothetical protein
MHSNSHRSQSLLQVGRSANGGGAPTRGGGGGAPGCGRPCSFLPSSPTPASCGQRAAVGGAPSRGRPCSFLPASPTPASCGQRAAAGGPAPATASHWAAGSRPATDGWGGDEAFGGKQMKLEHVSSTVRRPAAPTLLSRKRYTPSVHTHQKKSF